MLVSLKGVKTIFVNLMCDKRNENACELNNNNNTENTARKRDECALRYSGAFRCLVHLPQGGTQAQFAGKERKSVENANVLLLSETRIKA